MQKGFAMKAFLLFFLIGLGIYLMHRFCLWLERKGRIYYRHKKPQTGIMGSGLQELNAILQPSNRHVIEMKQNEVKFKRSEVDVPSEPKDETNK